MSAQHTPGPWTYRWLSQKEAPKMYKDEPDVWPIEIYVDGGSAAGSTIASIEHDSNCDPVDRHSFESMANACLIAVAPEQHEALQKIKEKAKPGQQMTLEDAIDALCDIWNISNAAIAKVKGETHA